ncbi:hypothetical protein RB213_004454 [Colletotrichum asianum]
MASPESYTPHPSPSRMRRSTSSRQRQMFYMCRWTGIASLCELRHEAD